MNLDYLIEYEEEGTNLDFKMKEYNSKNYSDLIKDVMSMANAFNDDTKIIIIGIKHKPGEEREFIGIDTLTDQATFENVIQENIEPTVNFKYYDYIFDGKKYGVLEIANNPDKPYAMRKDYKELHKGEIWIRKGTRQSRANRTEIVELAGTGDQYRFTKKIKLGFGKDIGNVVHLNRTIIDKEGSPSHREEKRLKVLLKKLEERYYSDNDTPQTAASPLFEKTGISAVLGIFSEFNDSDKSIRVGTNQMGLPVYNDRKKLLERIATVKKDYSEDDKYYIYEENSQKLNFYILNDGSEFLEDVRIELFFDAKVFIISEEKPEEPREPIVINPVLKIPPIRPVNIGNYPIVSKSGETIVVTEHINKVRHKIPTLVFREDLRTLIRPASGIEKSEIKYTISAKNLPEPIEGALIVNIK